MEFKIKERYGFEDFKALVAALRAPDGCPWDREQTHKSARKNFIEEVYECCEAIDDENIPLLREELGDVMLQIMLHSAMEEESGNFTVEDVINEVCQKLVHRHPHVFGDVKADNSTEVLKNWDKIKADTKGQKKASETVADVPKTLPALMRAQKIVKRAKKSGFDDNNVEYYCENIVKDCIKLLQNAQIEEIIGRIFLNIVEIAEISQKDSEECLTNATKNYINRLKVFERK